MFVCGVCACLHGRVCMHARIKKIAKITIHHFQVDAVDLDPCICGLPISFLHLCSNICSEIPKVMILASENLSSLHKIVYLKSPCGQIS